MPRGAAPGPDGPGSPRPRPPAARAHPPPPPPPSRRRVRDLQLRLATGAGDSPQPSPVGRRLGDGAPAAGAAGDGAPGGELAEALARREEEVARVRGENGRLRRELEGAWGQVRDMKRFLNDYGMVWVGEDDPGKYVEVEGEGRAAPREDRRPRPTVESLGIDVGRLERRVAALNGQAPGGAPAVPLTLYRDGVQLHVFPFAPFTEPSARALVQDLVDGYSPYQLREDFPDGACLVLVDKSGLDYGLAAAPGGGPRPPAGAGPGPAGNVRGLSDLGRGGGKGAPMSKEDYLKKLPQAVIKNGKMIPVRGGIEEMLSGRARPGGAGAAGGRPPLPGNGAGSFDAMMDTPAIHQLLAGRRPMKGGAAGKGALRLLSGSEDGRDGAGGFVLPGAHASAPASEAASARVSQTEGEAGELGETLTGGERATLQVKTPAGHTLVLAMRGEATLARLHARIASQLGSTKFQIRSAFPPRAYTDMDETLEAAGLVPSATLFVREEK